jgi:oligopeptide transport system ATP-binding protein
MAISDTQTKWDEAFEAVGDDEPMVDVSGLEKHFPVDEDLLGRPRGKVRAVDGVDFQIPRGETFGLVGESGSGKTTTGRALLRLIEPTAGRVDIGGVDVGGLSDSDLREFRRHVQIVFQDPTSSLNPRKTVKDIIKTPLDVHDIGTRPERLDRVRELLGMVDLPAEEFLYRTPSQLSGGQKQRIGIARAVATNPEFVVLDEPTSALDVSVQARVVDILDRLQREFGITYLFITHNLSLLRNVADRIGVMYLGRLVETGPTESVFTDPQHPYTKALLSAIPAVTAEDKQVLPEEIILDGEVPDPRERPSGCAFRSRCEREFGACADAEPGMYDVGEDHQSRCFLHDDQYPETYEPLSEREN